MEILIKKAKELLASKEVAMVIGFGKGSADRRRAIFAETEEQADLLMFDQKCVQNIAVYLTKTEIKKKGKLAIVAPLPVMRAIIQLASEHQLKETNLRVIGVTPDFKLIEFANFTEIEKYIADFNLSLNEKELEVISKIQNMPLEERWDFWMKELEPCFKCYACRAACPMCYCTKCTVEDNQPQWIPVPAHALGNLEYHIMRAMHLAGRCVACDSCANACPLGIPLNFLTQIMIQDIGKNFNVSLNPTLSGANVLATFTPGDKETFIK